MGATGGHSASFVVTFACRTQNKQQLGSAWPGIEFQLLSLLFLLVPLVLPLRLASPAGQPEWPDKQSEHRKQVADVVDEVADLCRLRVNERGQVSSW